MQFAHEIATSQVVWAILCIILAASVIREMRKENVKRENDLIGLYEDYRSESKQREDKLMDHLERSNDSQEQTTTALQSVNETLKTMEGRIDRIEKITYKKKETNK